MPAPAAHARRDDGQPRLPQGGLPRYAEFHDLPNIWLVGWSFGTDLTLMHGHDPAVKGAILLSPPLRFSDPEHLQVVPVEGAKHLWVGDAETALDEIVRRVAPAVDLPRPREWEGEMETADTSAYNARNRGAFRDVEVPGPLQG